MRKHGTNEGKRIKKESFVHKKTSVGPFISPVLIVNNKSFWYVIFPDKAQFIVKLLKIPCSKMQSYTTRPTQIGYKAAEKEPECFWLRKL